MRSSLAALHCAGGSALAVRPSSKPATPLGSCAASSRLRKGTLQAHASQQRPPAKTALTPTRHRQPGPLPTKQQPAVPPQQKNNVVPSFRLGTKVLAKPATQPSTQLQAAQKRDTSPLAKAPADAKPGAPAAPEVVAKPSSSRTSWADWVSNPVPDVQEPVGLVLGSAWLMSVLVQLTGTVALPPLWVPVVAGGVVGAVTSAAHRHGVRRLWRSPAAPLRVLITGGSSGIGKALAREFLRCGDHVVITSRSLRAAQAGAGLLTEELREAGVEDCTVTGLECDVSSASSVDALMRNAARVLGGGLDLVINNAGFSGSYKSLLEQSPEQVVQVVQTNLTGSLLVTRAAMRTMSRQATGGHIFNTEGAGSDNTPTPNYAAYGATKVAIAQLLKSLQYEASTLPGPVRVHNMSPGMVLTPLLLAGATTQTKQIFNILCEHPETVAAFLVPRARTVVARNRRGAAIRYLTPTRALLKFLAAPWRLGRYFDRDGQPVYAPERERLLGAAQAKRTQRRQRAVARRSAGLQLAYSLGMAMSFWLIVNDAVAKAPSTLLP